jgi:predicted PolB exonuclease-like 3'-5' exonuclease
VPRFLTLDLETVPDEALVSAVAGGAGGERARTYDEQLEGLLVARRAQSGGRSDFLPLPYHRPVAACTLEAVEDDGALLPAELGCWTDASGDEAGQLQKLWKKLRGRTLVTFHGRGFDLPVLELRSLKLGVAAPSWFSGRRAAAAGEHHDLFELLSNDGAAAAAPLDLYAKLVGLPGKDGVDGKDVRGLYAAGALERIAAYCATDVVQTWLLYLRFRLLEGSLSTAAYERSAAAARERLPALFSRRFGKDERALLEAFLERCAPFFERDFRPALRRAL